MVVGTRRPRMLPSRTFLYGYRTREVPLPAVPPPDDTTIALRSSARLYDPYRRRPMAVAVTPRVLPGILPRPDTQDPFSAAEGISKRMAFKPCDPNVQLMGEFRRFVRDYVRRTFVPLTDEYFCRSFESPVSGEVDSGPRNRTDGDLCFEEWLQDTHYTLSRKDELRRLYREITSCDLEGLHAKYAGTGLETYSRVDIFTKDEFYEEFKYPRTIWARCDEFKVISGPFFKAVERVVFEHPDFIKHVPVLERPSSIRESLDGIGFTFNGTDYVSFESLYTEQLMDSAEFELYRYMAGATDDFEPWTSDSIHGHPDRFDGIRVETSASNRLFTPDEWRQFFGLFDEHGNCRVSCPEEVRGGGDGVKQDVPGNLRDPLRVPSDEGVDGRREFQGESGGCGLREGSAGEGPIGEAESACDLLRMDRDQDPLHEVHSEDSSRVPDLHVDRLPGDASVSSDNLYPSPSGHNRVQYSGIKGKPNYPFDTSFDVSSLCINPLATISRCVRANNLCFSRALVVLVAIKRMSGEMCTSLGNGFTNAMVMRFVKHKMQEEADRQKVEGDDGLSATMKPLTQGLFLDLGLNIKILSFQELCHASFCGQVFDCNDNILTHPIRAIVLMPWIGSMYMFAKKDKQLGIFKAKCLSYLWQYNGCPIIMPYCLRMLQLLSGVKVRNIWSGYWMSQVKKMMLGDFVPRPITNDGRRICFDLYGIPVEDQIRIEQQIFGLTEITNDISSIYPYVKPVWEKNSDTYVMQWSVADTVSIFHPPFPRLEDPTRSTNSPIVNYTDTTTQIQMMRGKLSKKQYFDLNATAFKKLTAAEKNAKYSAYVQKQNRINSLQARVPTNSNRRTPRSAKVKSQTAPRQARMTKSPLSRCLVEYAKASIDPFDQAVADPCIPDNVVVSSYKSSVSINAQATVGTQGVAILGLNPWTAMASGMGASATHVDTPLLVSSATYSSSTIDFTHAAFAAGEIEAYNSNSMLGVATVGTQPMRLVAAGMEIMYTGQLLSQSGAITTLQVAGLSYLATGTTFSQLRNDPRSRTCSVAKGARCYISYYPTNDSVLGYNKLTTYMPSNTPALASPSGCYTPLVIAINGGTPGTTFQVKVRCFYESQLPGASSTPSDADPIGFPAFQAARTQLAASDQPSDDLREVLGQTLKNVAKSVSGILPAAGGALGAYLGNAQLGAIAGSAGQGILNTILNGASESF